MKYAKFDVQYLQDGTWHLNKRFDNLEDAEKRYEDGAKNWLHWEGRMPTTAVRIRRVTIQETYETIRQTEPAIRPEVHLTEPGDYLVHIGDSEASVKPVSAPADPPVWSSWDELLKASRALNAAQERLVYLHRQQRAHMIPGEDRAPLDARVANQQNLVDDLNLRVLAHARKLGRDIPAQDAAPAPKEFPEYDRYEVLRRRAGETWEVVKNGITGLPLDFKAEVSANAYVDSLLELTDATVYMVRGVRYQILGTREVPREPRVNDRVQGKTSLRKGTVVEGHRQGVPGLIAVQFDGHQKVLYGLDPKNFRVIETELTERPAPEVIQFPGPPASPVSYTDSSGIVVKLPGRTEAPAKFEVQVRRAGTWEPWPSPGVWYGNEHYAMGYYENLTPHGHVAGTGVRLLVDGVVIRETTKDPEPPAERFKIELFHDGEWHPDQPGGFVTHAAAASHYENVVRRWFGRGGIRGVRLLKDGLTIREKREH